MAGIDLSIPAGKVFGLLGANGAGKSTLLRILTGLVHASSGEVRLLGEPLSPATLGRVGALVEAPSFYPYMTGRETLDLLARYHRAPLDPAALLERVGIADAADRRVDRYSLGMKQRLGIACALIGDPEIVILDEPTNGMDPPGIRDVRTLLRELAEKDGRSVIFSSHLLAEVEQACDRIAVLDRGRLRDERDLDGANAGEQRLRIEASPIERVVELLGEAATRDGDAAIVRIARNEVPELVATLTSAGIAIFELRRVDTGLEDLYFSGDPA